MTAPQIADMMISNNSLWTVQIRSRDNINWCNYIQNFDSLNFVLNSKDEYNWRLL